MDLSDSWKAPHTTPAFGTRWGQTWCDIMCLNGKWQSSGLPFADIYSTLVTDGLGFSETLLCKGNMPYLWRDHYLNIVRSLSLLGIGANSLPTADELRRRIEVLISRNHYPPYSRIHMLFWQRFDDTMSVNWAIFQERLSSNPYEVDTRAIMLNIFDETTLPTTAYSCVNMPSPVTFMAKRAAIAANLDAACLRNADGRIATTTMGNIYLIMEREIITPHTDSGARLDALAETFERVCQKKGFIVKYTSGLTVGMVSRAQECMVAGAAFGMRCVGGIEDKRFYKENALKIAETLRGMFIF